MTGREAGTFDFDVPEGVVTVEHAADLVIRDGLLAAGSGAEAAYPHELVPVRVATDKPLRVAVTLAVLNSPRSGRRVAFLELHLGAGTPVTWTEEKQLFIGTDGGDGGFVTTPARIPTHPRNADSDLDVFSPKDGSPGTECVVRRSEGGPPDGILFSTGYGDGGYPTLVGRTADGRIVSVVSYGLVVPWALSGLPGAPPQPVIDETARRAVTPQK